MSRPFPIDTALYLTAHEFVPTEPEPRRSAMTTWWAIPAQDVWVEHQQLMPLLYTGAMWSLVGQGRLRLSMGEDGVVTATQVELSEERKQQMVDDRMAGLRPDSYDSDVMLGFSQEQRSKPRASDGPLTVNELAGWGRIHDRTGIERYRLAPHDELAHREVLLTPEAWEGSGIGGAWRKFKRRAKSHDYEPKPRADEMELDEANLGAITPLADDAVSQFRTWQSEEPDLARAVFGECSAAVAGPSHYKGVRLGAV